MEKPCFRVVLISDTCKLCSINESLTEGKQSPKLARFTFAFFFSKMSNFGTSVEKQRLVKFWSYIFHINLFINLYIAWRSVTKSVTHGLAAWPSGLETCYFNEIVNYTTYSFSVQTPRSSCDYTIKALVLYKPCTIWIANFEFYNFHSLSCAGRVLCLKTDRLKNI